MDDTQGEIRWLGDMVRLKPQPEETFVLQCDRPLSQQQREHVREAWKRVMGDVPLLVFDGGVRLVVLAKSEVAQT